MKDILVTMRVSPEWLSGTHEASQEEVLEAVKEAVEEIMYHGESRGFQHRLSDDLSIVVTDVDVKEVSFEE